MSDDSIDDGVETYQIITANRLSDGHVVYLTLNGDQTGWTTRAQSATVFAAGDAGAALLRAEVDEKANIVVGLYATEITGKTEPLGAKESIRASGGPSIRFGETRVTPKDPDYSI